MNNLTYQQKGIGEFRVKGTGIHGRNGPYFPEIVVNAQLDLVPYKSRDTTVGTDARDWQTSPLHRIGSFRDAIYQA